MKNSEEKSESRTPGGAGMVLVVDDDARFRERVVRAFADRGMEAVGAGDAATAVRAVREAGPDLAVVDLRLGTESGLEVIRQIKAADETVTVLVLTGYGSIATALSAMRLGAADYLTKPADVDQILAAYARVALGAVQGDETVEVPSLGRVEWEHIQRVLADCGGNISQAAKLLGIHRRSLQRKLGKRPLE